MTMMLRITSVYFADCINFDNQRLGVIKIGISVEPQRRAKAIAAGQPYTCAILTHCPGGFVEEAVIHEMLREDRIDGEFFADTASVRKIISSVCETGVLPFQVSPLQSHKLPVTPSGAEHFMKHHNLSIDKVAEITGRHRAFYVAGLRFRKVPRAMVASLIVAANDQGRTVDYERDFMIRH